MKHIRLGCRTAGFKFADIVEVGTGKGKISLKDAEALIEDGLAVEYTAPVAAVGK